MAERRRRIFRPLPRVRELGYAHLSGLSSRSSYSRIHRACAARAAHHPHLDFLPLVNEGDSYGSRRGGS